MVLKTFNVQEEAYNKFSSFCKGHGVSMSKQVEMFMESMVEEEPKAKKGCLEKIERIRKGKFTRAKSIADRYGL